MFEWKRKQIFLKQPNDQEIRGSGDQLKPSPAIDNSQADHI